ncbi:formate/nitrite transporter family protein [Natronospora cellulosivora (SeqCode)]
MFVENINNLASSAKAKADYIENSLLRFIVLAIFAGFFVGIAVMLVFSVAAPLHAVDSPFTTLVMGASFALALSLVIFAGSELFTGNNLITIVGYLEVEINFKEMSKLSLWGFIGNLLGSIIFAWLVYQSGLISEQPIANFILNSTEIKMNLPIMELFFRGVLCNILVTLAIWMSFKVKSDTGKLILIFWCLFAFVASGFEHSIANMSLFSMGLFIPHPETITVMGFLRNMIPVTLGNVLGGTFFTGFLYWYVSNNKEEKDEKKSAFQRNTAL